MGEGRKEERNKGVGEEERKEREGRKIKEGRKGGRR